MSPQECVMQYPQYLSDYERQEILDFNAVYYVNITGEKKFPLQNNASPSQNNHGFDNEKNEYIAYAKDHIAYRFEIKK